jgi:spore germination protein GerM
MTVKLFFPSQDEMLLGSEDQTIFRSAGVANRAKQIVQKLVEGPQSRELSPSIPAGTNIQELFVSEQKIAFIDFSNTIATNHAGGVLNEQATIYSIVNSLTYNLPEIQQVKILIGGVEKETLAGHCLLLLPLEMDLSITNVTSRPEAAAAVAGAQTYD